MTDFLQFYERGGGSGAQGDDNGGKQHKEQQDVERCGAEGESEERAQHGAGRAEYHRGAGCFPVIPSFAQHLDPAAPAVTAIFSTSPPGDRSSAAP